MEESTNDDDLWKDEIFFSSQDPLIRKTEEKHHPDTGKRISIVQSGIAEVVGKQAVQEAANGVEEETQIVKATADSFSKN